MSLPADLIYFRAIVPEMADAVPFEIPNRALFKASEVCDLIKLQPYVLRSWEVEFPGLGVAKAAGAPRVYRKADVEQVARIKHLLLVEGLTLAGARRKLEEEQTTILADAPQIDELLGKNARERLTTVKQGLQSILAMLRTDAQPQRKSTTPAARGKAARRKPAPTRRRR